MVSEMPVWVCWESLGLQLAQTCLKSDPKGFSQAQLGFRDSTEKKIRSLRQRGGINYIELCEKPGG